MKSVNDRFEKWLNEKYGKHGKVTATCGGVLKVNMTKYIENMINKFPVKLRKKDVAKTLAGDNLFNLGTGAKLDTKRSEIFHTFVAKGLFLCKRAKTRYSTSDLGVMYESQRPKSTGLGETNESYEILKRDKE
jgi:hypothetical protein